MALVQRWYWSFVATIRLIMSVRQMAISRRIMYAAAPRPLLLLPFSLHTMPMPRLSFDAGQSRYCRCVDTLHAATMYCCRYASRGFRCLAAIRCFDVFRYHTCPCRRAMFATPCSRFTSRCHGVDADTFAKATPAIVTHAYMPGTMIRAMFVAIPYYATLLMLLLSLLPVYKATTPTPCSVADAIYVCAAGARYAQRRARWYTRSAGRCACAARVRAPRQSLCVCSAHLRFIRRYAALRASRFTLFATICHTLDDAH